MRRRDFLRRCLGIVIAPMARFLPWAAPAALVSSPISDLVNDTLRDLGKPKFTEIATNLQRHTAMRSLLSKRRVVLSLDREVTWQIRYEQPEQKMDMARGGTASG